MSEILHTFTSGAETIGCMENQFFGYQWFMWDSSGPPHVDEDRQLSGDEVSEWLEKNEIDYDDLLDDEWHQDAGFGSVEYTDDDELLHEVFVFINSFFGIKVYHFRDYYENSASESAHEYGENTTDRDRAMREACEHAKACDATPNYDDVLEEILSSGWFDRTCHESVICGICDRASDGVEGFLLIPRGARSMRNVLFFEDAEAILIQSVALSRKHVSQELAARDLLREINHFKLCEDEDEDAAE